MFKVVEHSVSESKYAVVMLNIKELKEEGTEVIVSVYHSKIENGFFTVDKDFFIRSFNIVVPNFRNATVELMEVESYNGYDYLHINVFTLDSKNVWQEWVAYLQVDDSREGKVVDCITEWSSEIDEGVPYRTIVDLGNGEKAWYRSKAGC